MTTTAPPGQGQISGTVLFYSQPEPLSPETHAKMGVKSMDGPFGFAKAGHAIPLTVGEFPLAGSGLCNSTFCSPCTSIR